MKKMAIIFLSIFHFTIAHADEVASTSQMPTFLEIAKDANGNLDFMVKDEAIKYCESIGARLPTFPELALLSMSMGAKGFVSDCGQSEKNCQRYENVQNPDGIMHTFYFNSTGYQRPSPLVQGDLWSSSVVSNSPFRGFVLSRFHGQFAIAYSTKTSSDTATVRCVLDP